MQNVDFKCELRDPDLARALLRKLGAIRVGLSEQRDTYYRVPDGRLKRREADGEPVEWIVYHRRDRPLPSISKFTIFSPDQLRERYGTRPLPEWLSFTKTREVFLMHGVRVHLDHVHTLGWFLEVDALVSASRNVARCHQQIARVRHSLGPALGGPLACSYADLVSLEREIGAEGDIQEPEWFKNWRDPEEVIDNVDLLGEPPDENAA